ncbi:MAG TPA: GIY-YIG nuclease family protein [Lacibacter sp.]|nr:GIY-YIG nuclease family protein [Lacibacter sp.]HMO88773.1 GIY-YIG nuclease family protein [Lacibacter sp.]HMP85709.1 GIY-YIG nuclease family protein [Lacibacter sp.]
MEQQPHRFFTYIIQSKKDGSFYIGQCSDLDARLSKHNEGFSSYTAAKKPWRLVYFEAFHSRSEAIRREKLIKRQKSKTYLLQLIQNKFK